MHKKKKNHTDLPSKGSSTKISFIIGLASAKRKQKIELISKHKIIQCKVFIAKRSWTDFILRACLVDCNRRCNVIVISRI